MTWQDIRALRAAPTGFAVNDKGRQALFQAALGQAEELATAAAAVGYAASPLPLFYSLSQASRAIVAARHQGVKYTVKGHGLHFDVAHRLPERESTDLDRTLYGKVSPPAPPRPAKTCPHCDEVITPVGRPTRQAFQVVAEATESAQLAGPAELGALWAANPDLTHVPIPEGFGRWPTVLDAPMGGNTSGQHPPIPTLGEPMEKTHGMVWAHLNLPLMTGGELAQVLERYPTLRGACGLTEDYVRAGAGDVVALTSGENEPDRIAVVTDAPEDIPESTLWNLRALMFSVVEVDTTLPVWPRPNFRGYASPAVGGGLSPSPLMLWWALLLGLSSLARYHPAAWAQAINVDSSRLAVPLQQVLDVAADRVPVRVLAALRS
ncbi:YaaC family protein [Actinoplanes auranticolor]|uniref:YaaC-like protein n=1 Tax=Actinoplanes auranticolor TaxID=47988 RepID=A0A919S548_9ACTN|nr:hypothetical protein [Actinoplanes auranticolor]GIM64603.1 hypothetical protein Aau02nite_11520 [Actinoplanes auranticolor]